MKERSNKSEERSNRFAALSLVVAVIAVIASATVGWQQIQTSARISAFEQSQAFVPVCLDWARYVEDRRAHLKEKGLTDREIDIRIERLGQVVYTRLFHSINDTDRGADLKDPFTKERHLTPVSLSFLCGTAQEYRIAGETREDLRIGSYTPPTTQTTPPISPGLPSPVPTESLWHYDDQRRWPTSNR